MQIKTIAFLGSKEIGHWCLSHLLSKKNELGIEVTAVLSNNRTINPEKESVPELASRHNLPLFDEPDALTDLCPDLILSVQYHRILTPEQIASAQKLAVNLHMAPLPEYRGCNQFSFAIIDRASEFGTTLHKMTPGIDAGDILFEKRFPVSDDETVLSLYEKTFEASTQLFASHLRDLLTGNFTPVSQRELARLRKTGFHMRSEIEGIKQIDLSWPEETIDRHIRATWFPPFDPPYAVVNGKKINLSPAWREELKELGITI